MATEPRGVTPQRLAELAVEAIGDFDNVTGERVVNVAMRIAKEEPRLTDARHAFEVLGEIQVKLAAARAKVDDLVRQLELEQAPRAPEREQGGQA